MIKHTIFAVLLGLVAFVTYLVVYVGAFQPVKISEGEAAPFRLLYKEHVGAYHKIVPVIQEVETWAKMHDIDCTHSFGLYLNDPRSTEEERLRSWGGCWIEKDPVEALPSDLKLGSWEAPFFVKAIFEGSPGIGPMKVYPKAEEYIAEKNLKRREGVLEVYVVHGPKEMTTTYYFPVEKPAAAGEKKE
jgi:hypothetical protein